MSRLVSGSDLTRFGSMSAITSGQVPAMKIFEMSLKRGKFDEARRLPSGEMMEFAHIYPMDAIYDAPEDVPTEVISPWRSSAR